MGLKALWKSLQTEEGKLKSSLRQTRRNADKYLNDYLTKIEDLQEKLRKARIDAQDTNNFGTIAETKLKLVAEQKKFDKYVEFYKDEFGKESCNL